MLKNSPDNAQMNIPSKSHNSISDSSNDSNSSGSTNNAHPYYTSKIDQLIDIFGTTNINLLESQIIVDGTTYPIVDDVIILLPERLYPPSLLSRMNKSFDNFKATEASGVQYSFSDEWTTFSEILPEHYREFNLYFDVINLQELQNSRVCDLGCGIGRWSYILEPHVKEMVLLDFSDAIFVARKHFNHTDKAIFFMGDIRELPFRDNCFDLVFSLGVLHHIPENALTLIRNLYRLSPRFLGYLYYALDNRPWYYQLIWKISDPVRRVLCQIQNHTLRLGISWFLTLTVYFPFVLLGKFLAIFGAADHVPLYEAHKDDSLKRICQDCYDRFFTGIEQRFSKKEILTLKDTFSDVTVADGEAYWHFLCER